MVGLGILRAIIISVFRNPKLEKMAFGGFCGVALTCDRKSGDWMFSFRLFLLAGARVVEFHPRTPPPPAHSTSSNAIDCQNISTKRSLTVLGVASKYGDPRQIKAEELQPLCAH